MQSIAIFASAFHPSLGGVEELVRQLAHAYRKRGLEVIIITNRWPRSLPEAELYEGIPVYRPALRFPEGSAKAQFSYRLTSHAILRQVLSILQKHRVQMLHVQCVSSNGYYALQASRALALPLIVTSQGERTMDADRVFDKSTFLNHTLRTLLKEADFVTTCSQNTLDDLESYWGQPLGDRAQVIYNGIELKDFQNAAPYAHLRPYILGIGRLVQQKGFDVLIRAFSKARLSNCDLLIAGDGRESDSLKRLADQLHLQNQVIFLGRADRATTTALFKGCDFFVLPSRHEPLGIVNLEAMAAGKAVIATRVGGVPEIVADGENGILVAPDDVDNLATALEALSRNEELKERLASCGSQRVAQFSWARIAEQYLALYEHVLNGRAVLPYSLS